MQVLYALETGALEFLEENEKPGKSAGKHNNLTPEEKLLDKKFEKTLALFAWQVWFLTEVARYAESDARLRAGKHLPSAEDLNVPVKIAGNELLWRILESSYYREQIPLHKPHLLENDDWVRTIYRNLVATSQYALYNASQGRDKKQEKELIDLIYHELMLCNEDWTNFAAELFTNWEDDAEMLQQIMASYLSKPGLFKADAMLDEEKRRFGHDLLEAVRDRKEQLDSEVAPRLVNWDADRLALLDEIIMRMGVAEFLYFDTIPPKVTINEYIDIAKAYSTPQSGQFINGILDGIRKDLESKGRLNKVVFKNKPSK